MTELQQALRQYMEAVAAELARRGESLPEMPANAQAVRAQDLMDLVETARRLAKSGARESAEQLLSQLQSMLDAMRRGLENSGDAQQLLEANKLMNDLQGLAGRQQDLLDETFQHLQELRAQAQRQGARRGQPRQGEGTPGGKGRGADGRPGSADQEALRRELGDLMLRFDEVLGGTNSRERFLGTRALLEHLRGLDGCVLVTTHDLELARIADEDPQRVHLAHFADRAALEERADAADVAFDYRLRPGVVQSTNALRVMRAAGLPVAEAEG